MKKILLSILLISMPSIANAASIFIGAPGVSSNVFPFGFGFGANSNYQQVYNKNQFDSSILISSVSFRSNGGSLVSGGLYSLSISTTQTQVDSLSNMFNNNLGPDNREVFLGILAPNFNGTDLTFNFLRPYLYNPINGNLLLSFKISGFQNGGIGFAANSGNANGIFSRIHDFGGGFAGFGLQTTFNGVLGVSAVPEPATWAMMLFGFGFVGSALRRQQSRLAVKLA
jgi:hypothetical protein